MGLKLDFGAVRPHYHFMTVPHHMPFMPQPTYSNFVRFVRQKGWVSSERGQSDFLKMAFWLYQTYRYPRVLMTIYDELYFNADEVSPFDINPDQLFDTIGAACLVALEYARCVEKERSPLQSKLTDLKGVWIEWRARLKITIKSWWISD